MTYVIDLGEITQDIASQTGGKALALSRLIRGGFEVPDGICIVADAYREFIGASSLAERLRLELARKPFAEMRWEELWDASARIRHMFVRTPIPDNLRTALSERLDRRLSGHAVAVRSSALGEDSSSVSFAGLHESYIDVSGTADILARVKQVWASLWSDAALLYRQELGLSVETSAMAVVVQVFVPGDRSGVAFSQSPVQNDVAVVEAVAGVGQGLVDGDVEPERWEFDRADGSIVSRSSPSEVRRMSSVGGTIRLEDLADHTGPLLGEEEALGVYRVARKAEELFDSPQDVEWTISAGAISVVQSRPITTHPADSDDKRAWHLSHRRSVENLKLLRRRIEDEILPDMESEADRLARMDLDALTDVDLAGEIREREESLARWTKVYWDDLIPFAHGMRLFGQAYNDAVDPDDPFLFVELLRPDTFESLERNRLLEEMAEILRLRPNVARAIEDHGLTGCPDEAFRSALDRYEARYGNLLGINADRDRLHQYLANLLLEMAGTADTSSSKPDRVDVDALENEFVLKFHDEDLAKELLDLGRASYRIRDDDNIYLDRFKGVLSAARDTACRRVNEQGRLCREGMSTVELTKALEQPNYHPIQDQPSKVHAEPYGVRTRQLVGQPAGHGMATGPARVINDQAELFSVKRGEVLVCDAIDPSMTIVAPLVAAIVERRGGMLIHGAIVAREYGIPCVTGIADATRRISNGDRITVDGYLGIVIIAPRTR